MNVPKRFDLIHVRLMVGSFNHWPKFFREAYRYSMYLVARSDQWQIGCLLDRDGMGAGFEDYLASTITRLLDWPQA